MAVSAGASTEQAVAAAAAVTAPAAVAPPPGIAGLFDAYDATQLLDLSLFKPGQVFCNVYDLCGSDAFRKINAVSTANNKMLIGGLFHAGVEVFGAEWCYGSTEEDSSGVSGIVPRSHPQHTYRTTVPLGYTSKTPQEVREVTGRLAEEWRGDQYHLVHNNCLTFANALCKELGVRSIPGWVDRAARAASAVNHTSRAAAEGARRTATLVRLVRSLTSEVGQETQQQARSLGSSIWRVARSVTQDLQQKAVTALLEEDSEPIAALRRNIANDKRQADKSAGSGWDKLGDLLGFPQVAPSPRKSGKAKARVERRVSPRAPEPVAAAVADQEPRDVPGAVDVGRCSKVGDGASNIAEAIARVATPAKAGSAARARPGAGSPTALCRAQDAAVATEVEQDCQE